MQTIGLASVTAVFAVVLLNMNGVAFMLSGRDQMFSLGLVAAALISVWSTRWKVPKYALAYAASVLVFLSFASLFSIWSARGGMDYLPGPVGSIVLVSAVSAWIAHADGLNAGRAVSIVLVLLAISAIATVASPAITPMYAFPPLEQGRHSGLFANPNEAAVAGLYLYAIALHKLLVVGRTRYLVLVLLAIVAVLSTFSKAGILGLVAVTGFASWVAGIRSISGIAILFAIAFFLMVGGAWLESMITLEPVQERRLEQLMAIVSKGEISQETTTHRTSVWRAALSDIGERYVIFGSGLGSMRAVEGGLFEDGVWKGVHNFWLMILGEGGAIPLLIFFSMVCVLTWKVWRTRVVLRVVLGGGLMVLFVDSMSSHNLFEQRVHSVMLGLILGLMVRSRRDHMSVPDARSSHESYHMSGKSLMSGLKAVQGDPTMPMDGRIRPIDE